MALLKEEIENRILQTAKNTEFKDKPHSVVVWWMRFVCLAVSAFFLVITIIVAHSGLGLLLLALLLGICWLLAAAIFQLQWERYKESYVLKAQIQKNNPEK
ncbi:MAG: hypothetical protein WC071_09415 [Victivallaceae bacterium]